MRLLTLSVCLGLLTTHLAAAAPTPAALQARYDQMTQAYLKGNPALLQPLLAPDVKFIDTQGETLPVAAVLASIDPNVMKYTAVQYELRDVKLDGNKATVRAWQSVAGNALAAGTPQPFEGSGLSEDLWQKVNGQWLLSESRILETETRIAGQVIRQVAAPPLDEAVLSARRSALQSVLRPIRTVQPGAQNSDFNWLGNFVQGTRLIGAGEGSHGTAEHFQLKDRLFRELVQNYGFTVFAIEADFDDGYEVDRFVRGEGPNDPDAATRAFDFWTWQTQEVRDLLVWIRQYNATRGDRPELRVVGIDMQDPAGSVALLARLAPGSARVQAALRPLQGITAQEWSEIGRTSPERRAAILGQISELQQALDALPASTPDRDVLRHLANTVRQGVLLFLGEGVDFNRLNVIRDAAMAGNVRWVLDTLFPGQKAMLWAHNFHIARRPAQGQGYTPMGQHLARDLGSGYRTLGFSFAAGELRAISGDPAQQAGGPLTLKVPAAPADSLDALAVTASPAAFLELRLAQTQPVLREWFRSPVGIAAVGALYTEGVPVRAQVNLLQAFDGMIFVKQGSAARPLAKNTGTP